MSDSIEVDSQFIVTCSVCLSDYDGESRKQKFLPCLHSFCQSCLTQVKQSDRINGPICRKEVRISSGDVSSLPDTYFGSLKEMERKMKEIELKEQLKQEKEKISEEMKRKIAEQGEKIYLFRWAHTRLVNESNELKRVKKSMETVIAKKDQQIHLLNEFVTEIELGKKFEDTKYRKRQVEEQAAPQAASFEGPEPRPEPQEILEFLDYKDKTIRENLFRDPDEEIVEQLSNNALRKIAAIRYLEEEIRQLEEEIGRN